MKLTDEAISEALAAIYEASVDPSRWNEAMLRCARLVGAHASSMQIISPANSGSVGVASAGIDTDVFREYFEYYQFDDPWMARAAEIQRSGNVTLGTDLISFAEFSKLKVYNELYIRNDISDTCVIPLFGDENYAVATFNCGATQQCFSEDDRRFVEFLKPHLRRALAFNQSLTTTATKPVLDALDFPAAIIDGDGRIIKANQAFEPFARAQGIFNLSLEKLSFKDADAQSTFDAARAQKAVSFIPYRTKSSALAVAALSFLKPSSTSPFAAFLETPKFLLAFPNDKAGEAGLLTALKTHGLTPAECDLAMRIRHGDTVRDAADRLKLTEQTARWRLKQIFSKLHVNRQAQLVAKMVELTVPIVGESASLAGE